MTKERRARKRGHKNDEVRERRINGMAEGLEVANHPVFDEQSEQSMPVTADARQGYLVRSTEDAPG